MSEIDDKLDRAVAGAQGVYDYTTDPSLGTVAQAQRLEDLATRLFAVPKWGPLCAVTTPALGGMELNVLGANMYAGGHVVAFVRTGLINCQWHAELVVGAYVLRARNSHRTLDVSYGYLYQNNDTEAASQRWTFADGKMSNLATPDLVVTVGERIGDAAPLTMAAPTGGPEQTFHLTDLATGVTPTQDVHEVLRQLAEAPE